MLQNGRTICAGKYTFVTKTSCETLSDTGEWNITHNLLTETWDHTSWSYNDDIMLIGGSGGPRTTYLARADGTSEQLYNLQDNSM